MIIWRMYLQYDAMKVDETKRHRQFQLADRKVNDADLKTRIEFIDD